VRTEEFLAAMKFGYSKPPAGQLSLHLAGGPSPFAENNLRLLQVSVQAPDSQESREPISLTLAVDVSRGMQKGGRLQMAQRAIGDVLDRLRPGDRISLLQIDEGAEVLVEDAGLQDADSVRSAAAALRPGTTADLPSGVQMGLNAAHSLASKQQRGRSLFVLVSDGSSGVDASGLVRLEGAFQQAAAAGIQSAVIDVGRGALPDSDLAALASAAGGKSMRATSSEEVRWALLEAIDGRSQIAAGKAEVSIAFNEQVVASYRLLGNEAAAFPASPIADLHLGETSTSLYELQFKPGGGSLVATAELKWTDPATGERRSAAASIQRREFAARYSAAAEPWQLATLAAETASWLRRSPYRRDVHASQLLDLAGQTSESLRQTPGFQELQQLMQRAEKAQPTPLRRARQGL
jgi:Ca-activated chloride channel family protein